MYPYTTMVLRNTSQVHVFSVLKMVPCKMHVTGGSRPLCHQLVQGELHITLRHVRRV